MKKIVGILGMAAVLATGAFAAEPAANFVMSEFTGSYDFGVKANFLPKDVEFGMFNTPDASIKFGFLSAGDKTTTGDGIWGELSIKTSDAVDLTSPVSLLKASVETAKIHLVNGDFTAALNIKAPTLEIAEIGSATATGAGLKADAVNVTGNLNSGFALELGMADLFNFNVRFMDKGLGIAAKDQKYGLGLDASLLAVENLSAKVAGVFNFETKNIGFGADAAYKLGINDKLYVKPSVAFAMLKEDGKDKAASSLEAGVLFGWGAIEQEPGFKFVSNKTAEGVSVAFKSNLDKKNELVIGLYDQSVLGLLGDDFGTLKTGFDFAMNLESKTNTVQAGVKYDVTFSPVYVSLAGDVKAVMVKDADTALDYNVGVKVGTKEIIDNTDLYVQYDYTKFATPTKDNVDVNALTVGTKISF